MTETLVPTVKTMCDPLAVYLALQVAWAAQIPGSNPSRASKLTLLAQWDVETGGGRSCNNFNPAGLKHVKGDGRNFARYLTEEEINGKRVTIEQDFRAYDTLQDGVNDYFGELRGTFGFAWPAVESGDVDDFVHRLKLRGYFTAKESDYDALLRSRYLALEKLIPPDPSDPVEDSIADLDVEKNPYG